MLNHWKYFLGLLKPQFVTIKHNKMGPPNYKLVYKPLYLPATIVIYLPFLATYKATERYRTGAPSCSYWSYVHQRSYRLGAPHCMNPRVFHPAYSEQFTAANRPANDDG